jgi:hypothetical protein
MHMTFASTPCRLAFAPLPAPPGFSRCRFDSWSATDFLSTATPNSPVALTFSLPSCTRWACHSHFSRLGDNSHRGDRRIAHPLRCFVPLASVPMIVVLLVAIFTVRLPNGFSSIKLPPTTGRGLISVSRGTRRTCSISPLYSRFALAAPGRCRSMVLSAHVGKLNGSAAANQGRVPDREARVCLS